MFHRSSFSAKSFSQISFFGLKAAAPAQQGGNLTFWWQPPRRKKSRQDDTLDVLPKIAPLVAEIAAEQIEKQIDRKMAEALLRQRLEAEDVAWQAFYAELLTRAKDAYLTEQIRREMIAQAIIDAAMVQQAIAQQEEDEAIVRMMFEFM